MNQIKWARLKPYNQLKHSIKKPNEYEEYKNTVKQTDLHMSRMVKGIFTWNDEQRRDRAQGEKRWLQWNEKAQISVRSANDTQRENEGKR